MRTTISCLAGLKSTYPVTGKLCLVQQIVKNNEKSKHSAYNYIITPSKNTTPSTFPLVLLNNFGHGIQTCSTIPIRSVLRYMWHILILNVITFIGAFAVDAEPWHSQLCTQRLEGLIICTSAFPVTVQAPRHQIGVLERTAVVRAISDLAVEIWALEGSKRYRFIFSDCTILWHFHSS